MNIFDVIHQYREGIERSEVGMLRDLARLWVPSYRYLKQQVKDLMTVIQAQRDRGEPVWIGYLHSMERYQSMMEQARRTIDAYNRAALGRISGEEADAVEIGRETARKLVNIAAANDPLWIRVNKREGRILSGMLSEMSPLRALLDKSWPETSRKLDEVLTVGLTTGQGSNWIAQRMMEAVTIPEKRALLIARTEVNRTYREANLETMRESRAVIGYRRMCYPPTACFACLEMDGEFYEKGESFSDHPNGKCSAVPVTKHFDPINDPNWERGQQWFERQSPDTQRKIMGAGRYELWKNEGVNPRDMVYIKENPFWGGSPTMKTLEELKSEKQKEIKNITSGGRITNPYSSEALAFAENEYRQIRMMVNDVAQIAEHTGENESVIKEIKNYLFIDNSLYDEDSKTYRQFDPDCAIAQSWQRLFTGKNIKPHDLTLINHEKLEMQIKRDNPGISHDEAHIRASMVYNYGEEAYEYYGNLEKNRKKQQSN